MTQSVSPSVLFSPEAPGVVIPPVVWLSIWVLSLLIAAALFPDLFARRDPIQPDLAHAFLPPSAEFWFGTDQSGRDIYSRVVHGARYSLVMGFGATLISLVFGAILGIAAGYLRGLAGRSLTRLIDVLLAFPDILIALLFVAVFGPGEWSVLLAIGIGRIPASARLVRVQVLQVRHAGYVTAGIGLGLTPAQLVWRHVAPNSVASLLVMSIIGVGTAIIWGAGLSFLGLGAQSPTPEWGLMLSDARQFLAVAPWSGIFPGLFITLTVIAVTVTGRWLQQTFVQRSPA